ncbi:MAG: hypothetical protein N2115_06325, partial [bacterium]|nr:hypothetical protein [bacterium]
MSLTLYTPGTGFPDLEAKIAYGLARVGIEAGHEFEMSPESGFYKINFEVADSEKLKTTFILILRRLLSSDRLFNLGVKAKDKKNYSSREEIIDKIKPIDFTSLFNLRTVSGFNNKKDLFCGHIGIPKFGGSSGLILISSFHAGKPYERDKRFATFNQSLCTICGYLAVLGLYSFTFNIQMGKGRNRKYVLILPIPEKKLTKEELMALFSSQKTLHNFWLSNLIPLKTFTIGLFAKVPS